MDNPENVRLLEGGMLVTYDTTRPHNVSFLKSENSDKLRTSNVWPTEVVYGSIPNRCILARVVVTWNGRTYDISTVAVSRKFSASTRDFPKGSFATIDDFLDEAAYFLSLAMLVASERDL